MLAKLSWWRRGTPVLSPVLASVALLTLVAALIGCAGRSPGIQAEDLAIPGTHPGPELDRDLLAAVVREIVEHPGEAAGRDLQTDAIVVRRPIPAHGDAVFFRLDRAPLWNPTVLNDLANDTGVSIARPGSGPCYAAACREGTVEMYLGMPEVQGDSATVYALLSVRTEWTVDENRRTYRSEGLYRLVNDGSVWRVVYRIGLPNPTTANQVLPPG